MMVRALTLATATTLAAAAIAGTTPAYADDCVSYSGGQLNGTIVCAYPDNPGVTWVTRYLTVGSICFQPYFCTTPISQPVRMPASVGDPADINGQLCITQGLVHRCVPFNDDIVIGSLQITG